MPKIIGDSLAEHRGQVRQRLFDALMTLIVERGYDSVTLADTAAAAGVGRTAVYNHFTDKESVLLAMVDEQTDAYLARLDDALAELTDPIERLKAFVRSQLLELAGNHVQMAGLGPVVTEEGRVRIRAHIIPMCDILTEILTRAMAAGSIPHQDVRALVALIFSVTVGRVTRGLTGDELTAAVDAATAFVVRGVGVEEPS